MRGKEVVEGRTKGWLRGGWGVEGVQEWMLGGR